MVPATGSSHARVVEGVRTACTGAMGVEVLGIVALRSSNPPSLAIGMQLEWDFGDEKKDDRNNGATLDTWNLR
jgi:hypothetical protein